MLKIWGVCAAFILSRHSCKASLVQREPLFFCHPSLVGEGSRLGAHVLCLPQRGRGTAIAVDEEKVDGKLAIIKIRNDHNTSSVRRDIIYPTPKPSAHVCHLPQGEGLYLGFSSTLPKGKAFVWVSQPHYPRGRLSFECRRFATQGEGFFVIPII